MKRLFCMLLSAMIITMLPAVTLAETREESVIQELKEHCYINPDGGNKVHLDMNCPGVNPRHLPLTEVEYTEEISNKYHFCPICCGITESAYTSEKEWFRDLYTRYHTVPISLWSDLQVVWHDVNFRESPGGKVICRFKGGERLECLEEVWHNGSLWYHARSAGYGEGYIGGTWAKPLWHDLENWPVNDNTDVASYNMLFFAYWLGTYEVEHGITIIVDEGSGPSLSIAPPEARNAQPSVIPVDMRIAYAIKLYEYGLICKDQKYDKLKGEDLTLSEKDSIASSVLQNHYGTDDMWTILRHMSQAIFINETDWHSPRNQLSPKDSARLSAIMEIILDEHTERE